LLFAGAVILGEGPLKDLSLALFVGMVSGAYSSIFIATPLLAQLREREPDMKKLASRVAARRSKETQKDRAAEPNREPAGFEPVPAHNRVDAVADEATAAPPEGEPDDDELAAAALSARTGVKISRVSGAERPDIRPLSEGAAKRPQPQHKPRSQRKK
jgi:preprotein translocase subunit SecF